MYGIGYSELLVL